MDRKTRRSSLTFDAPGHFWTMHIRDHHPMHARAVRRTVLTRANTILSAPLLSLLFFNTIHQLFPGNKHATSRLGSHDLRPRRIQPPYLRVAHDLPGPFVAHSRTSRGVRRALAQSLLRKEERDERHGGHIHKCGGQGPGPLRRLAGALLQERGLAGLGRLRFWPLESSTVSMGAG
ncbi:hypothetical protein B0H15DRAFT_25645 [Mycena belliarum]|uniref:Uncharacterized protein n=1 Tax=Mycena belliarum TaxID=1033014 RepID=A0AAD6UJN2_9AGAR|nr:hypothetical protein B0H15DRAFT_25645 [Mycena belliae]